MPIARGYSTDYRAAPWNQVQVNVLSTEQLVERITDLEEAKAHARLKYSLAQVEVANARRELDEVSTRIRVCQINLDRRQRGVSE